MQQYIYHGDKLTDKKYKGQICTGIINPKTGKFRRGKNGNMLINFTEFGQVLIIGRCLRKLKI